MDIGHAWQSTKVINSDPKSNSTQDSGFHSSDSFSLSLLWCRWKKVRIITSNLIKLHVYEIIVHRHDWLNLVTYLLCACSSDVIPVSLSLVEQELLTLPEHLSSPPVFSGVRVTRSLVLYVCFVDRCLFFFDIQILIIPLVSSNSSYCLMSCYIQDKMMGQQCLTATGKVWRVG
jgi:hypothetical protein